MVGIRQIALGLGVWAVLAGAAAAGPRVSLGFHFGVPLYAPRPCYGHYYYHDYYYYRPRPVIIERPVVVQPAPIVVEQPPPVVVQPRPVVPPVQSSYQEPPVQPATVYSAPALANPDADRHLRLLTNPDERVRAEAVMELGRMKAEQAVDPLATTLSSDQSDMVRESAARALGLIGSPRGLTALTHAAQADRDRDVRRSAQFAVEVIQANRPR